MVRNLLNYLGKRKHLFYLTAKGSNDSIRLDSNSHVFLAIISCEVVTLQSASRSLFFYAIALMVRPKRNNLPQSYLPLLLRLSQYARYLNFFYYPGSASLNIWAQHHQRGLWYLQRFISLIPHPKLYHITRSPRIHRLSAENSTDH